jgi:hypothetical protein
MRTPFAAAVAVAVALAPMPAAAAELMTHLTSKYIADSLTSIGATKVEIKKPEPGVEIVSFNDGSGPVDFFLMNCTAEGCTTLQMSTAYEKDPRFTLEGVNAFNNTMLNVQAVFLDDGGVALRRLYVTNGGVTEANYQFNANIFFAAPAGFEKHIADRTVAAAEKGTPQSLPAAGQARALQLGAAAATAMPVRLEKWLAARPRRTLKP